MAGDATGETVHLALRCAEHLGAGTSGSVHGISAIDGVRYALKIVELDGNSPSAAQLAECRLHASLPSHDYIVRYHFSWTHEHRLFLLLERVVGGELWDVLEEDGTVVDASERTEWVHQLLAAVSHCHAHGVAHRDISPWNAWVTTSEHGDAVTALAPCKAPTASNTEDGNKAATPVSAAHRKLKLGDLGLAVSVPSSGAPSSLCDLFGMQTDGFAPLDESAMGSLYSAPELGSESGYAGKEVDVFSAGMTLFAIWFGVVAQRASTQPPPGSANAGESDDAGDLTSCVERLKQDGCTLPAAWDDPSHASIATLVRRMVSHDPQQRPTAAEAQRLFREALEPTERPDEAAPASMLGQCVRMPVVVPDGQQRELHGVLSTSTTSRFGFCGMLLRRAMSRRVAPAPVKEVVL